MQYDKERIKNLLYESEMAKRRNKDLDDRLAAVQEKLNENLSEIYSKEVEIEKLQLQIDRRSTEQEGLTNERDYFKNNHDRMKDNFTSLEDKVNELFKENENMKLALTEKKKEIVTKDAIEKAYQLRFQELLKLSEDYKNQVDVLERTKETLEMNNKTYSEENGKLNQGLEKLNISMKKMNDERNLLKEQLEAANDKIKSFIGQIHHNEEIIARMNREQDKLKNSLSQSERYKYFFGTFKKFRIKSLF